MAPNGWSGLVGWCEHLAGLVLPVSCGGCDEPDRRWCRSCDALLGRPWRCEHLAGRLDTLAGPPPAPVWAVAEYTGSTRRAVVQWKDRGRLDLTRPFAAVLRAAAAELAGRPDSGLAGAASVAVVPVPSSTAARRARGASPVDGLARAVALGLRDGGLPARSVAALHRRGVRDQVGLDARRRQANLVGAVRVTSAVRPVTAVPGVAALLVDDVLTTGATFAACVRALARAGLTVRAGVVLASTPRPGRLATSSRPVSAAASTLCDADPECRGSTGVSVGTERAAGLAWGSEPKVADVPPGPP